LVYFIHFDPLTPLGFAFLVATVVDPSSHQPNNNEINSNKKKNSKNIIKQIL